MFDLIVKGGCARIILNRPQARNAIPLDGWETLALTVEEAGRSGSKAVIISGSGGAFCAGADLQDFDRLGNDPAARREFRHGMRRAFEAIRALPLPSVAMIDGACYGAGVALAMACDLRAASPRSSFAITPAKLGISYPQGDIHRLVTLVGPGQAARILFSGQAIDGLEAARIGLVEICDLDEAEGMILAMLANSANSLIVLKRGIGIATEGISSDCEQDRSFDDLLGGLELADRLMAIRQAKAKRQT